ncbi:putative Late embryogenesis abundant protein, LEA-14 [Rosa chinensis]|uniref:Putative Late embryogenesis abundant protein, LEA-14 n=1 Tax=Rosa chinensis TaxID=74649 RepID=A0A2P6RIM4_ROSCH|nr:uncharacterized protein LOC112189238 [Rosa chinensis]PRQ46282.1 putative Late embryogenesis abundant protein, LEA-14 [Rosa chinensis]
MADQYSQANPLSPANANLRSDHEAATMQSQAELKRKKRIKVAIYVTVFVVVQIIVVTVFALTVMRVKTPKVRLGKINVQNITAVPATPSFDINFTTQIRVKNTNWGPYKFDASKVTFEYNGDTVAQLSVPKGKAGMRSTKKFDVAVSLNSKGLKNSNLANDLNTGVLSLTSTAKLTGKVELMLVMKKKKAAAMYCDLQFNLSTKQIQFLRCN